MSSVSICISNEASVYVTWYQSLLHAPVYAVHVSYVLNSTQQLGEDASAHLVASDRVYFAHYSL